MDSEGNKNTVWKINIRKKLMELYEKRNEMKKLAELLFFLDVVDQSQGEGSGEAPFWNTLKVAYEQGPKGDEMLVLYADQMHEDALECKKRPELVELMKLIYARMMKAQDTSFLAEDLSLLEAIKKTSVTEQKGAAAGFGYGILQVWDVMPPEMRMQMVTFVKEVAVTYQGPLVYLEQNLSLLNKCGGKVVAVGLAAIFLTIEMWRNMQRWWRGEISTERCAKYCADSLIELGSGLAGAWVGSAIGSLIFPGVGTVLGGILGGVSCGAIGKAVADKITTEIFDVPKGEAEEKAYKFLGVHHKASNNEVNKAYHKLCLQFHPDKGGSYPDWHKLQFHMGMIKLARGEYK